MKATQKKRELKDDSLFGLLSLYKANNTYFLLKESEEKNRIVVILTDNPGNWSNIPSDTYDNYRELRRLEIGTTKLSVKYISPVHLIQILGPMLGIKIPMDKVTVINEIRDKGLFIFETTLKYRSRVIQGINKIIALTPQKKYEILEKCIAEKQE